MSIRLTKDAVQGVLRLTLVEFNRHFERGTLEGWEYKDASIDTENPHRGKYCCKLEKVDSYITQWLPESIPVSILSGIELFLRSETGTGGIYIIFHFHDGTTKIVIPTPIPTSWTLRFSWPPWEDVFDKSLTGIQIMVMDNPPVWVDDLSIGILYPIHRIYMKSTDKDIHFTGAIAQNAVGEESLTGLVCNKITVTKIAIQAMENLDFDVMFFGKDTFENANLDVDSFQAFERLDIPTNGIRIGVANQYYLAVSGLNIDYEDEDGTKELHIALRCRSAAGKSAGATGAVKLTFTYVPRV